MAVSHNSNTCEADSFGEVCGAPAKYRGLIWGKLLCEAHARMTYWSANENIARIGDPNKNHVHFHRR